LILRLIAIVIWVSVFLSTVAISIPQNLVQQAVTGGSKSAEISLAQFINDTLKEMNLPGNITIAGLSNADKLLLKNFKKVNEATITATVSIKKTPFEVVKFTPSGQSHPLLIVSTKSLDLSQVISGISGTPLGNLGTLENVAFVYSPEKFSGKLSAPYSLDVDLSPGMNLIASVLTANLPSEMKELMKSVGVEPNRKISINGKISPSIFKNIFKSSASASSGLADSAQMKTKIRSLLNTYGKDFLSSLDLSGNLPQSLKAGPIELKGGKFILRGSKTGNAISLGIEVTSANVSKLEISDIFISYDADKKKVKAAGDVKSGSLPSLLSFKGMQFDEIKLASAYTAGQWDFKLDVGAKLHGKEVTAEVELSKSKSDKNSFQATLTGGKSGITARDVVGRDVPGFDKVLLDKVVLSNGRMVADLEFGAKKTKGEITVFHPGAGSKPVAAVTLAKVEFSDLVPGAAKSALAGVSVDGMTVVIVPKDGSLKPDDPAIPEKIAKNLKKVLADAAKHDAQKKTFVLKSGFSLLADLDIQGSKGIGSLMASGGLNQKVIPIVGTVSRSMFDKTATTAARLKDLDLKMSLPDLKMPGLPSGIKLAKPVFAITEIAPPSLPQPKGGPALTGPFVTIGADLMMKAGQKKHEFDALLMVGKNAAGKRVIDLIGKAKDPKGLFTFKGLTVKTLNLVSLYQKGQWDFKLGGVADLHGAELDFDTELIKDKGQKVQFVVTLTGGKSGIKARDVVGRDVPGFDKVLLDKVVLSNGRMVADLEFGAKKTKGEITVFHPGAGSKPVAAVTLAKVEFSDLVPGAAKSALAGVSVDGMTVVIVPKDGSLKPDDPAIPEKIAKNLKKVLADANKTKGYTLKDGFNLFAELDIKGSGSMGDMMNFIGRDPNKGFPIIGTISKQMFNTQVKGIDRFKGMNLGVPMPKINLSMLPGAFTFKNPEFKITDVDPSGKSGLWVGLVADLKADLMGKKIAFDADIGFSKGKVSLSALSEMKLPAPFGIKWLALKSLALNLDYDKKSKSGEIKFTAVSDKPIGKSTPKISIDLKEVKGKLMAGVLKIQEKVPFSDLPMLKGIPHANQFDFTFLEISNSGISGGSLLHGQKVDAVIFEHNKKWTFVISDNGGGKGFKFGRIMPLLNHTPLADFHLNDAALIFSQAEISGKVSQLPEVAQQVFTDIYGSTDAMVRVTNGITVAANFSPGNSLGFAGKGLKGIGIHDDLLIEGSVENIFGGQGAPGVDILVQVEQGPGGKKGASHTPKMVKFPGEVGFFIQYKAAELDIGLEADVVLHLPKKQTLDLVTKLELEINEKGFGVDIFMDLKGKWDKPFGIPGVDLEEVAIKFGIDMEGEAKFGFGGKCELADGAERIDVAAEMDFLIEASGLPDGIAMKGNIKELGIPAIIDVAERMAGAGASILPPNDIPLPLYRDVVFAFATPGATDPQLGLMSGFKLAGELFFLNRELGKVDLSAGLQGIKIDAKIDPIDLKVIKLDKNKMDFNLSFTSLPKLEIDSKIEFLGAEQDVLVKFEKGMVNMGFEDKIGGGIWDSKINLAFGFDLKNKGIPDIFIEGEVKEDFFKWLSDQAPEKVHQFFSVLKEDFEKAKKKINNAEAVVRSWDKKVQHRKEIVQREKANADKAIHYAESRVQSVKRDVDYAHGQAEYHKHKCYWYSAWHCVEEDYWWGRYGIEYAAYEVAEGVLHAAQEAVDHLPSELMDPQLDFLEGKQAAAMAALELAKLAIDGMEEADKWMSQGLETLLKKVGDTNALVIKEIFFEGDMDAMLKGGPVILSIDLEVFGDDLGTQMFAFKLTDPVYDAEQLAFIPLHMVSELFKTSLPKSLNKFLGPVLSSINSASKKAEQKVKNELKDLPGLNLPPDVQKALKASLLNNGAGHYPGLDEKADTRLAAVFDPVVQSDSGEQWMLLTQATEISAKPAGKPTIPKPPASSKKRKGISQPTASSKKRKDISQAERFKAYKGKRRNLLTHIVRRNKAFGDGLVAFSKGQKAERAENENDMYVPHTDVRVPPGELFTKRLLVARHSRLCLGQNGQGGMTFHPCNMKTGRLLWSTKRQLVNTSGHLIKWDSEFAKAFPNRIYTRLIHNGACLTTPFRLKDYDAKSKKKHRARLVEIAKGKPDHSDAHLKLSTCSPEGHGQLWKVVKDVHGTDPKQNGFKLQERDSAYCLRPGSAKAHTLKKSKEVKGVFYPCTGVAHATFELTIPNKDLPVWYDHNGVIKSDNGFCLDVPNNPISNSDQKGSAVYLKKCENDEYDRWDYVVDYDKSVKIINDFTGHCLYPYNEKEGKIPGVKTGQLVQRPCDGRYGQGWKMRVIPKQKWFQLEAVNSKKKATNNCMVPEKPNPKSSKVEVFVKSCSPATRGRWEFGHWKNTYIWTKWTRENSMKTSATNLSTTYWVSKDSLELKNKNGVCRVIIGNHDSGNSYEIYPGTWRGKKGTCNYVRNGRLKKVKPSKLVRSNVIVEVLSGLDIGKKRSTGSWKNSMGGVPKDSTGQNAYPPAPEFSAFMAGGDASHAPLYLCRVKSSQNKMWRYGYQRMTSKCATDAGTNITGASEVLFFKTVKNTDTGN
jgi:hypothetical protein